MNGGVKAGAIRRERGAVIGEGSAIMPGAVVLVDVPSRAVAKR